MKNYKLELSSLLSQLIGMMECWNVGIMDFGRLEYWIFLRIVLIIPYESDKISLTSFAFPVFHHSIIPGWKKRNGWLGTPYYQAFLEIPINNLLHPPATGGMKHGK